MHYCFHYFDLIDLSMTSFEFFIGIQSAKIQNFSTLFQFEMSFFCPSILLLPCIFFFHSLNQLLFFLIAGFFILNLHSQFIIVFFIAKFEKLLQECYLLALHLQEPFDFYLLKPDFFRKII